MKLFEIKKDYNNYLKDTGKNNTKETKIKFANDCFQWAVEMFGVGSDETAETQNEIQKFLNEKQKAYIIYNRFTGEQKQKLYTSRKEATDEAEKLNKKQNAYIYLVHKK